MADIIPKDLDLEGVQMLVRRGAQLVDVLPVEEYDQLHLPKAVSIPLSRFSRRTADELKWDVPVIVYSRDFLCDRSARAAWRLTSMGFTQVFRYKGGKADWLANGLPVEGAEAEKLRVADLADLDVPTCQRGETIKEIRARVQPEGWNVAVVINDQLVVLGFLRPTDLAKADPSWPAEETMERDPLTLRLDASPSQALKLMEDNRLDQVLITFPDGKLFGLLKREDLRAALA